MHDFHASDEIIFHLSLDSARSSSTFTRFGERREITYPELLDLLQRIGTDHDAIFILVLMLEYGDPWFTCLSSIVDGIRLASAGVASSPGLPACLREQFFVITHLALQRTQSLNLFRWSDSATLFPFSFHGVDAER
jgi:hypothetical protein